MNKDKYIDNLRGQLDKTNSKLMKTVNNVHISPCYFTSTNSVINDLQVKECKSDVDPILPTIATIEPTPKIVILPPRSKQIHETKCSKKCGWGVKTISNYTLNCPPEKPCFIDIKEYQKPCKLKDCPPNIKFGAWSDWSECSLSCKTDYEQKSVKSRIRTLEYYVKEHEDFKTETQECSVPMCPFKCPNIHLRLKKDESDILGLKVAKFS